MTTLQLHIEGAVAPVNAPNWANRTIFTGDNLEVSATRMNSGSVDLVYLDPAFQLQAASGQRSAWGAKTAGAGFQGHLDAGRTLT